MPKSIILHCLALLLFHSAAHAQPGKEVLLSETENAYNPVPDPSGILIAYVRMGWGRSGGSGGFGRSNLLSEVMVMDMDGRPRTTKSLADAFLAGWTPDGRNLVCYRDWRYYLVSLDGSITRQGKTPEDGDLRPERVAYLPDSLEFIWEQAGSPPVFTIPGKVVARLENIPSPVQEAFNENGPIAVTIDINGRDDLVAPSVERQLAGRKAAQVFACRLTLRP